MKRFTGFLLLLAFALPALSLGAAAENWKGKPYDNMFDVGGMAGLGILDGRAGFDIRGNAAVKIMNRGFVPDINNQLFIEAQPGVLFVYSSSAFVYSLHLRWDFTFNDDWTFYALGGVGGAFTGTDLGSRSEVYPRFGIGARWNVYANFGFRFELSHEFTGIGIVVPLI